MTLASVADVEVDYGTVSADEADRVQTLLDRAEAQIRQAYPDLDERLADDRTDTTLVVQVESEMVAAVLRNPGGYVSNTNSNTVGPYSTSTSGTLSTTLASGLLRLTRAQRALLGDPPGTAFTIPTAAAHPPEVYSPQRPEWRPEQWPWW